MARVSAILALLWFATPGSALAADELGPITVIGIGDSLLSGYGVTSLSGFPALLERRLIESGYDANVFDAGLQYSSKSGAYFIAHPYSRKEGREADLSAPNSVAIVELGSNDCVDGLTLEETRANLDRILSTFSAAQIPMLIVGTEAFESCGADYGIAFRALFPQLAAKFDALLYPDFKAGLYGRPELLQADLDHPNEAGEAVVVENMLPVVEQLIARLEERQD